MSVAESIDLDSSRLRDDARPSATGAAASSAAAHGSTVAASTSSYNREACDLAAARAFCMALRRCARLCRLYPEYALIHT